MISAMDDPTNAITPTDVSAFLAGIVSDLKGRCQSIDVAAVMIADHPYLEASATHLPEDERVILVELAGLIRKDVMQLLEITDKLQSYALRLERKAFPGDE
jgi:hypothetical protein